MGTTLSERTRRAVAVLWSMVLAVALLGGTTAQGSAPVAPLAVPVPTGNEAVISVRVGADRVGTSAVSGVAGTTLQLYDGTTAPTTPVADAWATCVSDADGDCSFVVPDTQAGRFGCFSSDAGDNCDRRFWVVQTGAPDGFFINPTLRTGPGDGTGSELTPYRFRTGATLRAGNTYTSQTTFMVSSGSTNRTASGGVWQQSRVNPALTTQCGLNVALVLDLSGSVTQTQLPQLKGAADTFIDSLVGTPSDVALFSFSTVSPAEGADQNYPGLTGVATQAGADQVKARYASWTAGGGTNWDRGLAVAAEANPTYDIVVVITDGDPTFYSQPAEGPGNFSRLREVGNGVFSANAVKAEGSRVLAVGVGSGVSDPATAVNLAAISGPTAYDGTNVLTADYFQVSDYEVVGQGLRQLALGECAGSLSVVKQLVGSDGDITTAEPGGAGWTFDAATTSPGVTLGTTSATTDQTSAVNFPLTYDGGVTSGTVAVTEQTQAGTTPFPVDGANAVCRDIDAGTSLPVTNTGPGGFSVDVANTEAVSCTVYNQVAEPATVTVDKEWVINGADPVPQGNQPGGFTSQLTLTGPGGAAATEQNWRVTRTGYVAGESVTIDEEVTLEPVAIDADLCTVATPQVVEVDGAVVTPVDVPTTGYQTALVAGANTFTIRNTVTCESRLTLVKDAQGTADPTQWTLSALPAPDAPAGQLPGPTGTTGAAGATDQVVTANVPYQLAESGGPPTYVQVDERTDLQTYPASTGSWNCLRVDADGNEVAGYGDGLNGGVTVPIAERIVCTATNQTAQLALAKEVVNDAGGTATPADFTLRAVPSTSPPVEGLTTVEVTGTAPDAATSVEVRPGHPYALSESGPAGYTSTEIQCTVDGETRAVTEITLEAGQDVLCVFVNDDDPAELTLRKVVDAGTTGATQTPADWTLTATPQGTTEQEPVSGNGADGVTDVEVVAGSYALTESEVAGFEAGDWTCVDASGATVTVTAGVVALTPGADVTCSITNTAVAPTLTLVKQVVNDQGGTAVATDWTLTATGPTAGVTGTTGAAAITQAPVAIGAYTLSESGGPAGYTAGAWTCLDGQTDVPVTDGAVTVALGQAVTCTVVNDDAAALLTLRKEVAAGDTGATQTPADWTLTATPQGITGQGPVSGDGASGVTSVEVFAGGYALSESEVAGFDAGTWSCTDAAGAVAVADDVVTLANGADVTCTITNTAVAPTLTLQKQVVNDQGGTAVATDWTLTATGPTAGVSGATGSPAVTQATVAIGDYTLSESGPAGYTAGDWTCLDGQTSVPVTDGVVTIAVGQDVTCTVVNADQPALLTLRKAVDAGASGATQTPADWTLTATPQGVTGQGPVSGDGATGVTSVAVFAGGYQLSESDVAGFAAGTWSCTDAAGEVAVADDVVTLANGADVTCTITNTAVAPRLTLVKDVTNDSGGTATPADWTLTATGPTAGVSGVTGEPAVTAATVAIGDYALSESGPAGYEADPWTCVDGDGTDVPVTGGTVTVALDQDVTCTVVNDDQPGVLTLTKVVVNDQGGTAVATDWTLTADGPTAGVSGASGSAAVTAVEVAAGAYTLTESGPAGYTAGDWTCLDGQTDVPVTDGVVTVALGQEVTCTVVNDDAAALLTLRKVVDAGASGATQTPADWTLTATPQGITGQGPVSGDGASGVTSVEVFAGGYALSESDVAGFEAGTWSCTDAAGAVTVADDVVTLANGAAVTCTITNTAQAPTLTLAKSVTNDHGGTATPADWTLTATGPTAGVSGVTGEPAVTAATVAIGDYALSESGPAGYEADPWTCVDGDGTDVPVTGGTVTVALDQDVTCTVVNDDLPALLTLTKVVVNDHGGTAEATDWTLSADGPTAGVSGASGTTAVTGAEVSAGTYDLAEDGPPDYTASAWSCEGGSLTGSALTVTNGETVVCTITNTFDAPVLTLVKEVVNDDAGTAVATDWTLSADGPEPVSGTTGSAAVTDAPVAPGAYTLSESGPEGYASAGWVCENRGAPLALEDDTVELAAGDAVTCTVVNDDVPPPTWTVVKTSDPVSGVEVQPGQVVTYLLVATVLTGDAADGVTVVDDLSQVLPYGTVVEGSVVATAGTASLDGTSLTWSVGTLEGEQTLTYRVRVADDVDGDVLRNVVTAPGAQSCDPVPGPEPEPQALAAQALVVPALLVTAADDAAVTATDDPEWCRTTEHPTPTVVPTPRPTPVPAPPASGSGWYGGLATTGAAIAPLLLAALGLLVAGAAVTRTVRRRARGDGPDAAGGVTG